MSATDSMVTLQERMVNLIGQLTMPVAEVALVLQHHIQGLLGSLNEYAQKTGASISDRVRHPWPIDSQTQISENLVTFDVEKVLKIVDQDRMDILSTLIRVTLVETEMDLVEGILALACMGTTRSSTTCRNNRTWPIVFSIGVPRRMVGS